MHELSIAHNIVKIVTDNVVDYPGARVNSITVMVGIYSGVDPEALKFSFPIVSEGTAAEGAELHIDSVPFKLTCKECGSSSVVSESMRCPVCGSIEIAVELGRELTVSSIDLELPDE